MSDNYIVSARKYRPATFRSVVGQQGLTATLRNSIKTGRLAQAYLFCGPRGVGKTSCARIFARAVNCMNPTEEGEACGQCESCLAIDRGNSYNLVELDAASNNGVDDIRAINDQVNVPPQTGRYRIFIIDEVHMLSTGAFNAFLKTLEEPPSYAIFILATTEKHKVIPTILSRCQIYDFKRITTDDIVEHLQYVAEQEGITADPKALGVIASKADGAMRDALSIFDQVSASCGGNLTYDRVTDSLNVLDYDFFFRLVDDFRRGDVGDALLVYKDIRDRGFDSLFFVNSLAQHVRDLMVAADKRTLPLLETPADVSQRLAEQASSLPLKWYYSALGLLNDCDFSYRTSSNKQLLVELTLIRLCQLIGGTTPFDNPPRKPPMRDPARGPEQMKGAAEGTRAPEPPRSAAAPQPAVAPQPAGAPQPAPATAKPAPAPERPAAPAQTAPTQPAPVAPAAAGTRRAVRRTVRLTPTSGEAASLERKRSAYTPEAFMAAWREYAALHPEHSILVSSMNETEPRKVADDEYLVRVQHPAQLQAYESAMPKILEHIRQRLDNDFVAIRVEIDNDAPAQKLLTPQEFVRKAISENPQLGEFLRSIEGEIV